jgi:isoleucyl-tRNA synthetase
LYANLDDFNPKTASFDKLEPYLTESDKWVLSRVGSVLKFADTCYQEYEPTKAVRAIQDFVCDELSNWYVRLNRKRFWKGEKGIDKEAAYFTLYTCLESVAKAIAPVAPFYAEDLYAKLQLQVEKGKAEDSVHLTLWPEMPETLSNPDLERRMELAQKISSMVHGLRKAHSLKVRQPLSRMLIPVLQPWFKDDVVQVADLITSEVNVKHIEFISDTEGVVTKKVKPNFKELGKTLGPKIKSATTALNSLSQAEISQFERN